MAETPSAPTPTPTESAPADAGVSTSSTTEIPNTLLTADASTETKPEATTEAPAEPKPVVPEKYDLKLGEAAIDPATLDVMTPVFKELGLTQEGAQKLVQTFSEHSQKAVQAQEAQREATYQTWLKDEATKNETTIRKEWGPEFQANLKLARDAYTRFGDSEVKRILEETGLGSHPSFLKMFLKVGPLIQEDKPTTNGTVPHRVTLEQALYPNMVQPH